MTPGPHVAVRLEGHLSWREEAIWGPRQVSRFLHKMLRIQNSWSHCSLCTGSCPIRWFLDPYHLRLQGIPGVACEMVDCTYRGLRIHCLQRKFLPGPRHSTWSLQMQTWGSPCPAAGCSLSPPRGRQGCCGWSKWNDAGVGDGEGMRRTSTHYSHTSTQHSKTLSFGFKNLVATIHPMKF